jgi:small nuclear ribonucleoprotein (snRNP)-like protein
MLQRKGVELNTRRTFKTSLHKTSPRQNVSIQNVTERLLQQNVGGTKRLRNKTSPY